jgi:Txe/YoeB family toxin of Txe-Axe toxin-antitoxin module
MQIVANDVTLEEIDEALDHLRLKLQDRYGNRLTHQQRQLYLESVNDLLDARIAMKAQN